MSNIPSAFLLAALAARAVASQPIVFDTAGGDAWAFNHPVHGHITPGTCDCVILRAAGGSTRASLDGSRFFAIAHLRSGANDLRAQCLKGKHTVATSPIQHWEVRIPDTPRAWIRARVDEQGFVQLDAGHTEPARGRPADIVRYEWQAGASNPAPLVLHSGKHIAVRAPAIDGTYYVTLRVTDSADRSDASTIEFRVVAGRPAAIDVEHERPAWLEGAVLYGLPIPLLTPFGFEGVRQRLDAIRALGATAIWLSPVTEAPTGDFGYAVTDQFRVRSAFGTDTQLRALITAAHERGLKVMLDVVTNHLAAGNAYYEDSVRAGPASAYYDWFERSASGQVAHYFDWGRLENINYDNPDVRGYISAALTHWVREYHVDGFRLDAGWAVRERAPELWPKLRAQLKRIDPDVVLLAEASERDPYYAARGFDVVYDWTEKLGQWAWQDVFGPPDSTPDLAQLRQALLESDRDTRGHTLVLRFLNNNDTGARFLTRHGLEQTRDAAVLLFTIPGLPLVYAGDEVGAAYDPYNGGPPITWFDPYGLQAFYTQLIRLRRTTPALRSGRLQLLRTDHDESVLAYLREAAPPDRPVLVVINFSPGSVVAQLQNPPLEARLAPHEFQILRR